MCCAAIRSLSLSQAVRCRTPIWPASRPFRDSRNAIDVKSLARLRDVFVDQFIASFDEPPSQITLDIDPFDDPTHGDQQLTFFHGYYGQYQYLPRAITCAENDLVVMLCLLFGTAHAALGSDDDLEYLVARLRDAFPAYASSCGQTAVLQLRQCTPFVNGWKSTSRSALA